MSFWLTVLLEWHNLQLQLTAATLQQHLLPTTHNSTLSAFLYHSWPAIQLTNIMPSSKKKKARGKARRAAKSREADEEDGVVNGIDSQMQRLQINNKNDEEDAMLEEAINREVAANNDEVNNFQICNHGFVPVPRSPVCLVFLKSFFDEYYACCRSNLDFYYLFEHIYEATKTTYAEVWNDPDKLNWIASRFTKQGTNEILDGYYHTAARSAVFSSFFEQCAVIKEYTKDQTHSSECLNWADFDRLCNWNKIFELYLGDDHTLMSFLRKRIPCKCLDKKYKEVKWITKIGLCCNEDCSLPGNKTARGEMLSCTQCRRASYCSRECQVAHWPSHKEFCVAAANMRAAQKSRQKK